MGCHPVHYVLDGSDNKYYACCTSAIRPLRQPEVAAWHQNLHPTFGVTLPWVSNCIVSSKIGDSVTRVGPWCIAPC